jgi:hypothetical protein
VARLRASATPSVLLVVVASSTSRRPIQPSRKRARPGDLHLGIHARLESIARAKDNVPTAHHSGLAEGAQCSQFGCGFVAQLQWELVSVRWLLSRGAVALGWLSLHPSTFPTSGMVRRRP